MNSFSMNRLTILTVWMLITVATITTTEAFSPSSTTTPTITRTNPTNPNPNPNPNTRTSSTSLLAASSTDNDNSTKDRRAFLRNVASAAFGTAATVASNSQPASASYSAFANREKDWEDRSKSGEIKTSTPLDLKSQLREIAPMNNSKSLMFCPNGPSSVVSPMMENKCDGERMAAPSVFGRSDDIVGNSIPGGKMYGYGYGGYESVGSGGSLANQAGGFPKYTK